MKAPTRILSFLLLGVSVFLFTACFDDGVVDWDRQLLAFDAGTGTTPSSTITLAADDSSSFVEEITVELAGPHQQNDISAVFEINDSETTATQGQHFDVLNSNNTAVIPAGSSFGQVEIQINAENFEPGESAVIVPRLTDESDWDIMENFRQYYLTVEKEEAEDDNGDD